MTVKIERFEAIKIVGMRQTMNLSENMTAELWGGFMLRCTEIKNRLNDDFISMQIYDAKLNFKHFNERTKFEKWAAVMVSKFADIPKGMSKFTIPAGLYAVFIHKGKAQEFPRTFNYIFNDWMPNSEYSLDKRPHFEILGEKYKNDHPDSQEEVCIPIKLKRAE